MTLTDKFKALTGGGATTVRVVIADDEIAVRRALRRIFERDQRFELVGEAADGREALEKVTSAAPDVVVLDLAMGDNDGIRAIPAIRAAAPDTKIVVLSSMVRFNEAGDDAVRLGAHQVLDKFTPPRTLMKTILRVARTEPE